MKANDRHPNCRCVTGSGQNAYGYYKGEVVPVHEFVLDGAEIQKGLDEITDTITLEENLEMHIKKENYERAAQIHKVLKERQ